MLCTVIFYFGQVAIITLPSGKRRFFRDTFPFKTGRKKVGQKNRGERGGTF